MYCQSCSMFVLILYVKVTNFSVMSGQFPVFLGWTSTKQRIKCLVHGLNTMHPSSLEPVTFDQVTYTLPEPLCSFTACLLWSMSIEQHLYQKCMGDLHKMKHVNRTTSLSKVHGRSTQNLYTKVKVRGMRNLKPNPLSHCLTRIALKFMLGMWYFKPKFLCSQCCGVQGVLLPTHLTSTTF